ncbi:MAG: hypothetical protein KKE24_09375 [Candidatus Thermoplasmatota archaeon]|nr:hypothetical protein [Candidatus Thermoplasmatota archaeon]
MKHVGYYHHVRQYEKDWHNVMDEPYALFIGEHPLNRYFYCTEDHEDGPDCSSYKRTILSNALFQVAQTCGCVVVEGRSKWANLLAFSHHFGLIDIFSSAEERKLGRFRNIAEDISEHIRDLATNCTRRRRLLVFSVLKDSPSHEAWLIWEMVKIVIRGESIVRIPRLVEGNIWPRGRSREIWIDCVCRKIDKEHSPPNMNPIVPRRRRFVRGNDPLRK